MDAQMKRGLTEACVLALLAKGDSYGYRLAQDARTLMPISESTLYPVLKRLQENGSVSTYSMEHGGRLRHYYRLTDAGREQMAAFAREWEQLGRIYDLIKTLQAEEKHHHSQGVQP